MTASELFHIPVLKREVLTDLFFDSVQTVFDGTLGLGGHAEQILTTYPNIQRYCASDLDQQHLNHAQKRLAQWAEKLDTHQGNYSQIETFLSTKDIPRPLVIFLDLGLCSHHVDNPQKGFSFQADGPLSMAFDAEHTEAQADKILNTGSLNELTKIFREYGDEPLARKIAYTICDTREKTPLQTTQDLRTIVESCTHPKDRNKTLMRVFQAVRIAVNDELTHIKKTLESGYKNLHSGDRMGIISYHALEDKIVKDFFREKSTPTTEANEFSLHAEIAPPQAKTLTKKPIVPSEEEIAHNPRARSAKFRILETL